MKLQKLIRLLCLALQATLDIWQRFIRLLHDRCPKCASRFVTGANGITCFCPKCGWCEWTDDIFCPDAALEEWPHKGRKE